MNMTCGMKLVIALVGVMLLLGCGANDKGKVSGTVTFAGQPVTGGSISFAPVAGSGTAPGRVATGAVRSDGTFSLSTDKDEDGAMIGRHEIVYTAPTVGGEAPDPAAAKSPYDGLVPSEPHVEVKAGANTFKIELKAKAAP